MTVSNRLYATLCLPLLLLSGCSVRQEIQELTASTITDSIPQLCQAGQRDIALAEEQYQGDILELTNAEIVRIDDHHLSTGTVRRYPVMLKAESATIFIDTNDEDQVAALIPGQHIDVSGVVDNIISDPTGCVIALKKADF